MKTGRWEIDGLASEVERQYNTKIDYRASTNKIGVVDGDDGVEFEVGGDFHPATDHAHGQVAAFTGIPKPYYDRMRAEVPALLGRNIRTWFDRKSEVRLARTLDGKMRAFLSNGYRPLDNYDFMGAIVPTILDKQLVIMSCEVTETRLYLKVVDPRILRDVPSGRKMGDGSHVFFDTCSPAAIFTNSEVGAGMLSVEHGVYTKVCTNMAMIAGEGMKRRHIGARHALTEEFEKIQHMLTDETRAATDKAVWLQVRDVMGSIFDENAFDARCKRLGEMSKDRIEKDVVEVVEATAKKFGLADMVRAKMQAHLIEGADLTRYGLFNAITRTAQDVESYDAASDLEKIGGKVVDLTQDDWKELALAA
jgi:hypothetical protein